MINLDELMKLQRDIDKNKQLISLASSLERLQKNPDFQLIIEKGYLMDEAVRLVHLRADAAMQSDIKQTTILRDIDAIGTLSQYLRGIKIQGDLAKRNLSDDEETYAELAGGAQ